MTIKQFKDQKPQWVWVWNRFNHKSLTRVECSFDAHENMEPDEVCFYIGCDYYDGITTAEELFSSGVVFASVKDFAEWALESDD